MIDLTVPEPPRHADAIAHHVTRPPSQGGAASGDATAISLVAATMPRARRSLLCRRARAARRLSHF